MFSEIMNFKEQSLKDYLLGYSFNFCQGMGFVSNFLQFKNFPQCVKKGFSLKFKMSLGVCLKMKSFCMVLVYNFKFSAGCLLAQRL